MEPARVDFVSMSTPENEKKIMATFDLTSAEARVALRLSDGMTIRAAAARCGFTEGGARTSLKRMFVKMDVNRQHQVVRLVILELLGKRAA